MLHLKIMEPSNQPQKDFELWRIAKRRAAFKRHLYTYIVINIFLWILWGIKQEPGESDTWLPWPAWATLGWGIGIALDYFNAYFGDRVDMTEKEYEKLLKQKKERGN